MTSPTRTSRRCRTTCRSVSRKAVSVSRIRSGRRRRALLTGARGIPRDGESNWRIACENGFDNAHTLTHQDNTIVQTLNWVLPLGILPADDDCITLIEDDDGPKGLMQWLFTDKWVPALENE